jgi:3,4-dihydroxy-2-butanone 4-phosphate synthase
VLDASGYICISVPEQRLKELDIKMMVPENQERHKTAYTVTVDAAEGACLLAGIVLKFEH